MIVSAAGNLEHASVEIRRPRVRDAREERRVHPPAAADRQAIRSAAHQELEQSHICLGYNSYQQNHEDRYVSYILNSVLGGSMSSRLFQNVREKRGLAYSVFSGMSAYRDAGNMTIYAAAPPMPSRK